MFMCRALTGNRLTRHGNDFEEDRGMNAYPPGTLVDIYSPRGYNHQWVWVTGYQIFNSKESSKERHKKLSGKKMLNPRTNQIEETCIVQRGAFVFPVCESQVRKSSSANKDLWNPADFRGSGVALKGFVVSDESDKADLESLDSPGMLESVDF
jgi:hypothetical protein